MIFFYYLKHIDFSLKIINLSLKWKKGNEEYDKEEFEKRFIKLFNNEGILKSSGMRYFNRDIGIWSYYEDDELIKTKGKDKWKKYYSYHFF